MENFLLPDQVARLHRSQLHIEMHLGERLRLNRLARAAAFSPFHYHRLFKRMTGESVCAHLGRVRLERAAFELVFSRHSVLDIAMGHGFTSPEAFARAFRRRFGTSPRAFRSSRTILNEQRDFVSEWRREFAPLQPDWRTEPPQRITFLRRQGPLPVAVSAAWEAMSRVLARSGAAIESERIGCTPDYPGFTPPDRFRFEHGSAGEHPVTGFGRNGRARSAGRTLRGFSSGDRHRGQPRAQFVVALSLRGLGAVKGYRD